jgi:hypothetical protein
MIKVFIDNQTMQGSLSGLVDQVKSKIDFNLKYFKKRCEDKYGIDKIIGVEHKGGNIVIYKNQVGCMLNYEVRFPMSVLITTKKNIDRTPLQNNDIPPELDLDDLEGINDIPPELDDLEQEHEVIDEFIEKPKKGLYKKKL